MPKRTTLERYSWATSLHAGFWIVFNRRIPVASREAISILVHTSDEACVFYKMKKTFKHHQDLVHNQQKTTDVLTDFKRILDVKGSVSFRININIKSYVSWYVFK